MNSETQRQTVFEKIDPRTLSDDQRAAIDKLIEAGQSHLFDDWDRAGSENDPCKASFLQQLADFDREYPGGIIGYVCKVRDLLNAEAEAQFEGLEIHQAPTIDLTEFNSAYFSAEQTGIDHADRIAYVLVAGGLGERLGYSGIKMEIPFEITAGTTYMKYYCESILALERRANRKRNETPVTIPFMIMTSDGTRERTEAYLESHKYFGLKAEQVFIFEQHLVPAVADGKGRFAKSDTYDLIFKPYGHGDVHSLLYQKGIAEELSERGKTHIIFIQDTNAPIMNLMMPALGVSLKEDYDFNMVCVPRVPGEPIGAVVQLGDGERSHTVNVEYNLLDSLLKRSGGDQAAPNSRYSPYPGNINLLIAKLDPYLKILDETKGAVAEFINPKYADGAKTVFKKPVRMETLMQDVAKSFPQGSNIGATLFERDWALAPLKNNIQAASEKARAGQPSYAAATAESGFYENGRRRLRLAGMEVERGETHAYHDIPFIAEGRVVLSPRFALSLQDVKDKVSGGFLSKNASLVIDGANVILENLRLEGKSALVIEACDEADVAVKDLTLSEDGYEFEPLSDEGLSSDAFPEVTTMRGYTLSTRNPAIYKINQPGEYIIGPDAVCRRIK